METFILTYREELARARREHPEDYPWPESELPAMQERMSAAIRRGSFNKDGRAFRQTCKRLGISYTYKAIRAYTQQAMPPAETLT